MLRSLVGSEMCIRDRPQRTRTEDPLEFEFLVNTFNRTEVSTDTNRHVTSKEVKFKIKPRHLSDPRQIDYLQSTYIVDRDPQGNTQMELIISRT